MSAGGVFRLFGGDILSGKIQVMSGSVLPLPLGDLGQFLVLLVAVALFVIGSLAREEAEKRRDDPRT